MAQRLTWSEIKHNATVFARDFARATREEADAKEFWNDFFAVFGLKRRHVAAFEAPVKKLDGHKGKIDLIWPGVMLAEHKSAGQSLSRAQVQAFAYIQGLIAEGRADEAPRFVILSDFQRIVLHDLEVEADAGAADDASGPATHRVEIKLSELPEHVHRFAFMLGQAPQRLRPEDPANQAAFKLMGRLHDLLVEAGYDGVDLERFLVRLLFCLFAEDTGIFEPLGFFTYISGRTRPDGSDLGAALEKLFQVLDTPPERRSKNLDDELAAFPYVNGRLFADRLRIADFNAEMHAALLRAANFYWARISPAVFGSLFQAVLGDEERRRKGAHYTSERDILKTIKGLFLDELEAEVTAAIADRSTGARKRQEAALARLGRLRLFDPACGCGNFLIIAFRELRRLELQLLRKLLEAQQVLNVQTYLQVSVEQCYGIELLEWPARIAEVALWLADHQANQAAAAAFGQYFVRLPLRETPHIAHGNALRLDWAAHLPPGDDVMVLGNPPFIGHSYTSAEQQADKARVFPSDGKFGKLDYVACWHAKAADYIQGTRARVAFVSTNSITQGEQASVLWPYLYSKGVEIEFAHRTFPWSSDAPGAAHVHVVIIGFSRVPREQRLLYDYDLGGDEPVCVTARPGISPYLTVGRPVTVPSRATPRPGQPQLRQGSKPVDGGHLIFTAEEKEAFVRAEPSAERWMRPYVGSQELINGGWRWCLWLKDCPAAELRAMPLVKERLARVRASREASPTPAFAAMAAQPALFVEDRQPDRPYLAVPEVSSERRRYIPLAWLPHTVIASNKLQISTEATFLHFGVLSSQLHMAWVRVVCGRLESRYSYSPSVMHNFPWPALAADAQSKVIESAAQRVLDERAYHLPPNGNATLADLYDPDTMPPGLVKAHQALDKAVDKLYRPERPFSSDRERVEHLFALFEAQAAPLVAKAKKPARKGRKVEEGQ
jgi:hypothetical protein